jgi:hypothetical protein
MTKAPPPGFNDRALGWLRYIWDKATTPDDWSDRGEPHPWRDRYCEPPMCSFPRFDSPDTAYVLPVIMTVLRRSLLIRGFINTEFVADHYQSFLKELIPLVALEKSAIARTLPRVWHQHRRP